MHSMNKTICNNKITKVFARLLQKAGEINCFIKHCIGELIGELLLI